MSSPTRPSPQDRPELAGALTLAERAALPHRPTARPTGETGEAARRRLERWRGQPPFDREDFFARRLAHEGLEEEDLLALLAEDRAALSARMPETLDWVRELEAALDAGDDPADLPFSPRLLSEPETRFLYLAAPLVRQAGRRLEARVEELVRASAESGRPPAFDPETVVGLLLDGLPDQLLWTVTRVGVVELNVARIEGRISGETPEERFAAFIERIRRPAEVRAVLLRFPVLARQLVVRIRNWTEATLELLDRLVEDWDRVQAELGAPGEPGVLSEFTSGAGDRHRGGRTVSILSFSSGWKLVYKPRPMALGAHFQELLAWFGDHGFEPGLRVLGVVDRGPYGWMEFAHPAPCTDAGEVARFYRRMGGYLALLYALDASDFHHENLIAAGEYPLLVDLESVVQPRPPTTNRADAGELAIEVISRSVLRIGLLPHRAFGGAGPGVDISGLGMIPGELMADAQPYWEDRGTDVMRLSRQRFGMPGGAHRPSLGGAMAEVSDYADDLIAGFTDAYRLLVAHRGELLGPGGLLDRMAGDEARVILRPTRTYGLLLQESFHPFLLADALERDIHFDNLWQGVAENPGMEPLVETERAELLRGDIPLFAARMDGYALLGAGDRSWPDFFERSGLDLVRTRLEALGEEDLDKQLWFVRASLAAHRINLLGGDRVVDPPLGVEADGEADRERLMAAARSLGDRLDRMALRGGGAATWIGVRSSQGKDWTLTPLGNDLYAGLPGVVVFLAYLAAATGEERYDELARAGWRTLWNEREALRPIVASVGGFDGWGGTLWTLAHLERLWGEPALLEEARAIVELLPQLVEQDLGYDVITGSAGCIAGLLALQSVAPDDRNLEVAVACGDHLLRSAEPAGPGIGWLSPGMRALASRPLTGFGHGAAGFAWALLELAAVTGEERFREAAEASLAYERSLFVPELGTWEEVREIENLNVAIEEEDDTYMLAWCHGAPGIGLARLRSARHLDDPRLLDDAEIAMATTLERGFDRSHCLCHGDLGNAELFLEAAASGNGDGERWRREAYRAAARVLESGAEHGWKSGLPRGVEVPSLMTGLAGIGYGLLRLARPEEVPSVLLLDPPGERVAA